MFLYTDKQLINSDYIRWIECYNLESGYIRLYFKDGSSELVKGPDAFDIVMRLSPAATEGKNLKQQRRRWWIHNLIGHPLMQIFSWLGFSALGIKIHDATVPTPKK